MKYHKDCSCCGHRLTAFTHNLNRSMVSSLVQFVNRYRETRRVINLQQDLDLTKNQYNNFQKLQYFGLVKRIPGGWVSTETGFKFVDNMTDIPATVATLGKDILPEDHEAWRTHKAQRKWVGIKSFLGINYKSKADYQAEKSGQEQLSYQQDTDR